MAITLEEVTAKLEVARLRLKLDEVDRRVEKVNGFIGDVEAKIDPEGGGEGRTHETISLTTQCLSELVNLRSLYADTLELAAEEAKDDVATIRDIKDSIDVRERRLKEAMQLLTELMKSNKL